MSSFHMPTFEEWWRTLRNSISVRRSFGRIFVLCASVFLIAHPGILFIILQILDRENILLTSRDVTKLCNLSPHRHIFLSLLNIKRGNPFQINYQNLTFFHHKMQLKVFIHFEGSLLPSHVLLCDSDCVFILLQHLSHLK